MSWTASRVSGPCRARTARVETEAGPLRLASIHLENRSTPDERAARVARLIEALSAAEERVVFTGDLNTSDFPAGPLPEALFADLPSVEPLFGRLAAAGLDWRAANTRDVTQRKRPDGTPAAPFRRIDWMAVRGVSVTHPATVAAVDAARSAISDHEVLVATIGLDDLRP